MGSQVEAMSPATLVGVVNEWGTVPRAVAGEGDQPYPAVAEMAPGLGIPDDVGHALTDDALTRAADLLHPVFAADTAEERAALATELLAAVSVRPTVAVVDGRPRRGWVVDEPRQALLAAAALALREQLAARGSDRLGVCSGRRCADVYIDASPTHDRRFCSVTCQTRARVAAFRRRRARAM